MGYLSLEETLKYISSSKVLINTSEFEGFPNVLIQAWFYNKPVISTVNPDDVFEKYKIGYFVENEIELTEKAYDLMSKNNIYNLFSSNTKQIFQNYHNPEMAYKKILNKINLDNES